MSFDACAQMVQRADEDRFLATMTAPVDRRGALFSLYAFNLEVARAPWVTGEALIAQMRLQWWRDALAEIYAGVPVRRHEVVEPLAMTIREHDLPRAPFEALIDARERDIETTPPASIEALQAYLSAAGGLMALAAGVCGGNLPKDTVAHIKGVGQAAGTATYITVIKNLKELGRQPLPMGLSTEEAVRQLADGAQSKLEAARAHRMPREVLPALRVATFAQTELRQALRDPEDAIRTPYVASDFARRVRMIWVILRKTW